MTETRICLEVEEEGKRVDKSQKEEGGTSGGLVRYCRHFYSFSHLSSDCIRLYEVEHKPRFFKKRIKYCAHSGAHR